MSNTDNKRKNLGNPGSLATSGSFGRPSGENATKKVVKGGGLKALQQLGALDDDEDMEAFAFTGMTGANNGQAPPMQTSMMTKR